MQFIDGQIPLEGENPFAFGHAHGTPALPKKKTTKQVGQLTQPDAAGKVKPAMPTSPRFAKLTAKAKAKPTAEEVQQAYFV